MYQVEVPQDVYKKDLSAYYATVSMHVNLDCFFAVNNKNEQGKMLKIVCFSPTISEIDIRNAKYHLRGIINLKFNCYPRKSARKLL